MTNNVEYVKGTKISLSEAGFNEAWLKDIIARDPSILGLGELVLKDSERMQPRAGRLDLLFQDPDEDKRYEVEIMLGKVDESHIIRCIEYWDLERKRYPNYDHVAVLVAEDITSRFLNVISLFNAAIPIIALQMNVIRIDNKISLDFTKVLDQMSFGIAEEEEISEREIADRAYWDSRGSQISMALLDQCGEILKQISSTLMFKYNKYYIGLVENTRVNNFLSFKPKKKFLSVTANVGDLETLAAKLTEKGLEAGLDKKWGCVRFILNDGEVAPNREFLKEIFAEAYRQSLE